ncbi:glycosyl hydrolase [Halomontanus rarus]|uniref:glycosyl hydrolase n=1 Tax=Halomontanus rarus TaxID=3034020 RepID=UPI001A9994A4
MTDGQTDDTDERSNDESTRDTDTEADADVDVNGMTRALSRRNYCTAVSTAMAGVGFGLTGSTRGAAATPTVGNGGYHDSPPAGADTHGYGRHTTAAFGDRPVPTNDWYSTVPLTAFNDEDRIVAHPLVFQTRENGLLVGHPTTWTTNFDRDELVGDASMDAEPDLRIGHANAGGFAEAALDDHGDWCASILWGEGTATTLRATIVQGSPFVFCEVDGGGAELEFEAAPTVWADRGTVLGVTVRETDYGLFAPDGRPWSGVGSRTLTTDGDYCTLAVLPSSDRPRETVLEAFEGYAYNVVTDTRIDWTYDQSTAEVTTTFRFETASLPESSTTGTIAALYPHQWKYSDATSRDGSEGENGDEDGDGDRDEDEGSVGALEGTYPSARGEMRLTAGESFAVTDEFRGILPTLPDVGGYDADELAGFFEDVDESVGGGVVQDTYRFGKDVATRLAKTAAVADQVGMEGERDRLLERVREGLEEWFTPSDRATFYYDDSLGVLQGVPGSHGSVTELNDHHFHFGHYVKAAAAIARYDPEWAAESEWGGMVEELICDYANPNRDDGRYPFNRNFSVYAGHSWAHGSGAFALGNNQESSSEALTAYAAMIEWGEYTDNDGIRDFGIVLYTTHIRAIQEYWFDRDDENQPDGWAVDFAGIVWGNGYAFSTWWTTDTEAIFGINVLPVDGHSLYLGWDEALANRTFEQLVAYNETGDTFEYWPDVHWLYRSFSDSEDALERFEARKDTYQPEDAQERAHTYYWLSTIDELGSPDPSVTADTPLYAVFEGGDGGGGEGNGDGDRNGNGNGGAEHTYVAYNADDTSTTVTFSDGTELAVPANAMATSRDEASSPNEPPAIDGSEPADTTGDGLYNDLTGSGQTTTSDVTVFFEHVDDPVVTEYPEYYDFDGNGQVTVIDVVDLFDSL